MYSVFILFVSDSSSEAEKENHLVLPSHAKPQRNIQPQHRAKVEVLTLSPGTVLFL